MNVSTLKQAYAILELRPGATLAQVKDSYRTLAFVWHPDRCPAGNERLKQKAQDKLKAINSAYETLQAKLLHHHPPSPHSSSPAPEPLTLRQCYQILEVNPGASLDQIKASYRDLAFIWHPDRCPNDNPKLLNKAQDKLQRLNQAYDKLVENITAFQRTTVTPQPHREPSVWEKANAGDEAAIQVIFIEELKQYPLNCEAQINYRAGQLTICFYQAHALSQQLGMAYVYLILFKLKLACLKGVKVYGLRTLSEAPWTSYMEAPTPIKPDVPINRFDFHNFKVNALAIPIVLALGLAIYFIPPLRLFHSLLHMLIHQLSHVVVASLGGRFSLMTVTTASFRATGSYGSAAIVLYGIVLLGLCHLAFESYKERLFKSMSLSLGLIVLQFVMTWLISNEAFVSLFSLAGITGELWLSACCLGLFYVQLPDFLRWDFFRYPMLLISGPSLVVSLLYWQWLALSEQTHLIQLSFLSMIPFWQEDLTWMIRQFGSTPLGWFNTLAFIGELSLLGVASVYLVAFLTTDPDMIKASYYRCILWWQAHTQTSKVQI